MPAGDGITFKYGDYTFDPRPLFNYTKEVIKTPANTGLSEKYNVTLNGHILPNIDLDDHKGGLTTVFDDTAALRDAFSKDFKLLLLQCDDDDPIISGYPKVINVDVSPASDNYVRRSDYTITLELVDLKGKRSNAVGLDCNGDTEGDLSSQGLISLTDEFSIEFSDEKIGTSDASLFGETFPSVFTITRQMSAQGNSLACGSPLGGEPEYKEPWERARDYIHANIGMQENPMRKMINLLCLEGNPIKLANNFRTITVNRPEGTVSSSESWVAYQSNQAAIEEVEVNIDRGTDSPLTSVSVNGTIIGLVPAITYNAQCDVGPSDNGSPKFDGAKAKWEFVKNKIYSRAKKMYDDPDISAHTPIAKGTLNTKPITETVGYNPIGGTITYGYTYDDRFNPINTNALSESITYTENDPTDLFASLTILGRGRAFLQDLNTQEPATLEISIDAILQPNANSDSSIPSSAYEGIMNRIGFVTNDSKSWSPSDGHFTWSKSWTIGSCW